MEPKRYPKEGSQRRIILDRLIAATGSPVGVDEFMRIARCAAVHSQVDALRKMGWNIQNRMRRVSANGQSIIHSEYWMPVSNEVNTCF